MTAARVRLARFLRRLHADQQGSQGLEKLLIVAAIVLPLLGLLIIFRNEIRNWVVDIWNQAKGDADANKDQFFGGKLK
jgi:Flp pilus assembly pilin Flp